MFKSAQQLFLTAFMVFTLLGVQAIQESPLHDHAQHTVDCALCHFELNDDTPASKGTSVPAVDQHLVYQVVEQQFTSSQYFSPYQGRAPPHFFL